MNEYVKIFLFGMIGGAAGCYFMFYFALQHFDYQFKKLLKELKEIRDLSTSQ